MGRNIIALDELTVNNVGVFKKINEVTLPCKYPETWYDQSLKSSDTVVQLAYYSELPVGAIKARAFNNTHPTTSPNFEELLASSVLQKTPNCIYIESFAVLEKYRGLGIGLKLLEWVIEQTKKRFIHEIIIHVHQLDEKVISWYKKRGFKEGEVAKDYYKNQGMNEPNAVILRLEI